MSHPRLSGHEPMLNMNFLESLSLPYHADHWQPSPANGVWRYPLEREQAESGHVTSLVRFEPGARFPEHLHPMGEEFWVLEGVFSDENGDYPAGTYARHPPGSRHGSFTEHGCTIFVKLNQFAIDDNQWLTVLPEQQLWLSGSAGYRRLPLHHHNGVHTSVLHFPDGGTFPACCYKGGLELLVLSGSLTNSALAARDTEAGTETSPENSTEKNDTFERLSWLRFAPGSQPHLQVAADTQLWVRTGHLSSD